MLWPKEIRRTIYFEHKTNGKVLESEITAIYYPDKPKVHFIAKLPPFTDPHEYLRQHEESVRLGIRMYFRGEGYILPVECEIVGGVMSFSF